jgi:molecular chaperone GrpE (heat shock protein)
VRGRWLRIRAVIHRHSDEPSEARSADGDNPVSLQHAFDVEGRSDTASVIEVAAIDPGRAEPVVDAASTPPAAISVASSDLLGQGIERLIQAWDEREARDRFRENQIDRLHDELQGYKADLISKATRPALQSLIRLHDDVAKVSEALQREDPAKLTPERFMKILDGFKDDVLIALEQNGVAAFQDPDDKFNPLRQKALKTVPGEPESLGRIAQRNRPGFERGDAVLEKERVTVYAASAPKDKVSASKEESK